MNGATLFTELRSATGTTSTNYSDTLVAIDLNKSYHFIEDMMTQEIWENFFYNEIISATVVGQKEYTMFTATAWNLDWQAKTLWVSIDYGYGYVKAVKKDMNSLDRDFDYYKTNQSQSDPFYTIQDNSIMIFPTPTVIGLLRQYIVQNLIDITTDTTEANMFNGKVHKKYHPLIALGAEQYSYARRQLKNEATEANTRFMNALLGYVSGGRRIPWMMDILNTRTRGARIRQMPDGFTVNL